MASAKPLPVDIEFSAVEEFEFWLEEMEDKISSTVKKPSTRLEACQLLSVTKKLHDEVVKREKPAELLKAEDDDLEYEGQDDEDDEPDPKVEELNGRYNLLRATLADNLAKAETLCVCWDKLNSDLGDLGKALSSGGAAKVTMDKLESTIAQIKDMFRERATIVDNLTPEAEQ